MPSRTGLRVGLVANEFFDPALGGYGGFGWAARRAARALETMPGIEAVVFLAGAGYDGPARLHGVEVRALAGPGDSARGRLANAIRHAREPVDLILSIDYRPSYPAWFLAYPRTPVVVWSRDPRTPCDWARIDTLRLPGHPDVVPGGTDGIDTRSLGRFVAKTRMLRRPVVLASKMRYLAAKAPETYGLPVSPHVLCNPDVVDYRRVRVEKAERPLVVSLARLDPIKRPWLLVELARRFPNVDVVVMGCNQTVGPGGWTPSDVPPNLRFAGHLDGPAKEAMLSAAWVLVNTSIHEESPVSMFEALAHEAALLSTIDSDDIVARHGVFTGRASGTGAEALPALTAGLETLLSHPERTRQLGRAGRRFTEATHSTERFQSQFAALCGAVGRPAQRRSRRAA